jgi:adenine-specific DNA-methyltransferase
MAAIEDLIKQIADPGLRDHLAAEVARLKATKKFGLVFEEHLPELLRLPSLPVRTGTRVLKKAERGTATYRVITTVNGQRIKIVPEAGGPEETVERESVVVAKAFGEPMYPALVPVDAIERAPGKPWHVLINADNYHALQLLLYGYEGKVDVIYIDPPYNSGARDWKYNNDYVDREDQFRHSKWLSMMKKRLVLAKRLLKPDRSFLVVTIDEKEYLRLGMLLEEIFPGHRIQMVSSQISPSGNARGKEFYRVDEYLFFVYVGDAQINEIPFVDGICVKPQEGDSNGAAIRDVRWESLLRSGSGSRREESKLKFYPVYVDTERGAIAEVGEPLPLDKHPSDVDVPSGLTPVWPMKQDGSEGRWQLSRKTFFKLQQSGHVKIGKINKKTGKVTLKYLPTGLRSKLARGEIIVTGRDEYGGLELAFSGATAQAGRPKTQWTKSDHSAADYGSSLLRRLMPDRIFTYPKSLYAVTDTLRLAAGNTQDALILDFFAGSGTTFHAAAYLNAIDGGNRRCVLVTNNEVEDEVARQSIEAQSFPGEAAFEKFGIAEWITWPRCKAAISGRTPAGKLIVGEYENRRRFDEGLDENFAYFKLDFLDPGDVTRGEKFESIVPILWILAGCRGACELSQGAGKWFIPKDNPFAVLLKEDAFAEFLTRLAKRPDINHAFLVTDSTEAFHEMAAELGRGYKAVQLYRSYLDTFRINLSEPGTITSGGVPAIPLAVASLPPFARGVSGAI